MLIFPFVRFLEQEKDATSYEQTMDIAGYIKHGHRMLQNYSKGVAGNLFKSYKYLFAFSFLYVLGDTPFNLLKIWEKADGLLNPAS